MKKLIFWLLLTGGAYASYRIGGVHWMIAFIGLCLAFGFLFKKLPAGSALRLVGFVILFVVVMLGAVSFLPGTGGKQPPGYGFSYGWFF
jgi:membrane protein implicated in regulation of membrane protease activity